MRIFTEPLVRARPRRPHLQDLALDAQLVAGTKTGIGQRRLSKPSPTQPLAVG